MRIGLRVLQPETVEWLRGALGAGELSRAALGRELCERDGWRNPRGGVVHGLGAQGAAGAGGGVGVGAAARAIGSAASWLRSVGVRVAVAADGILRQLFVVGGGRCADGGNGGGGPVVRSFAGGLPSAGSGSCAGVPSDVCAGSVVGGAGCSELRVGAVAVGAPRRAPGLGRPDAGCSHRAGGFQRPFSAVARGSGAAPGLARVGAGGGSSGVGLGSAARCSAGVGGDVRGGFSAGDELPGGGLAVRGPDVGFAAGGVGAGGAEGVWLRGLAADWEETLRWAPSRAPGSFPALSGEAEPCWSRREFGRSDLVDGRLRSRLVRLVRLGAGWERHPGEPLPAIFPGSAEQQAAYRYPAQ